MTGEQLKALRLNLGVTQYEMGQWLGITASAIAHMESGKHKVSKQTQMLAEKLLESRDGQ